MRKSKIVLSLVLQLVSLAFGQPAAVREGDFLCQDGDLNHVTLRVSRHPAKPEKLILNWTGRNRILHAVPTQTGAIRYEGAVSRLVYLQITSKSLLLDNRSMHTVLNECAWQDKTTKHDIHNIITHHGGSR